ncbi:response regulator [Aromatoleum toluvorans]|uniref:Response regulator n=1 Tax=Aromatoleum toluvorans TaxID=92002 RepID=A0ABX1PXD0_9RHOO|nr:hypothetical protein [Aromatoleum toluvorans]NMG43793.1 response regulator [Aromatoleum toluvorans]
MDPISLIETAKQFFDGQGALANAAGIVSFIGGGAIAAWKISAYVLQRVSTKKFNSISEWALAKYGNNGGLLTEKLRQSIRISFVDDNLADLPEAYIRSLKYDLTTFDHISLADISILERFDVVVLDITNVVPEDMRNGGLEIIKRLKSLPTPPLVIAVSQKKYDPTVSNFFKLADAVLKKPVKEAELEAALNRLLITLVTPNGLAKSIDTLLDTYVISENDRKNLNGQLIKALETNGKIMPEFENIKPISNRINNLLQRFYRFSVCYV